MRQSLSVFGSTLRAGAIAEAGTDALEQRTVFGRQRGGALGVQPRQYLVHAAHVLGLLLGLAALLRLLLGRQPRRERSGRLGGVPGGLERWVVVRIALVRQHGPRAVEVA